MPSFALMHTLWQCLDTDADKNSYILSNKSGCLFYFLSLSFPSSNLHRCRRWWRWRPWASFLAEIVEICLHKSQPSQLIVHANRLGSIFFRWFFIVAVSNNNNIEASVWFLRLYWVRLVFNMTRWHECINWTISLRSNHFQSSLLYAWNCDLSKWKLFPF